MERRSSHRLPEADDLVDRTASAGVFVDRKPQIAQKPEILEMGRRPVPGGEEGVGVHLQGTAGDERRILELERPRGGIPRIDEGLFARLLAGGVHGGESGVVHEHLAPHLDRAQ